MVVTGKFITLQKSLCYLNSNGNQVTIQKRAELHILSRYTHFQRTLLSECTKIIIYSVTTKETGRNLTFLQVFATFSLAIICLLVTKSILVTISFFLRQVHCPPTSPRQTASLLGCPFIAVTYSWASRREWYGNGATRRQHANFSLCHSFRTILNDGSLSWG